jgi:hypothetical protein
VSNVFKTYVRPILEYGTETWNPNLKKDVKRLERIQKFFTRIALSKCRLPYIPYEERLKLFDLRSLESCRVISDLIMVYKIIKRLTHLPPEKFFTLSDRPSRRHRYQIRLKHRTNKSFNSFVNRSTNRWNRLDDNIVTSSNIDLNYG